MKTWKQQVYLISLLFLFTLNIVAQQSQYGNEWIREELSYYRVAIEEEGIYRISATDLSAAGIPIESIQGGQWALYSYGQAIPIRISTNGTFSSDDFIEFYGTGNDGSVDASLYDIPTLQQLNPFVSLYSRFRPYFLTWIPEGGPSFFNEKSNGMNAIGLPPKEPYYIHKEIYTYSEFHNKPTHDGRNFIRYSSLDYGEGFGAPLEESSTISFEVSQLSAFGVRPRVKLKFGTNIYSNIWEIKANNKKITNGIRKGYGIVDIDEYIPLGELENGDFELNISPKDPYRQKHTLSRAELHYPRNYNFNGATNVIFHQQASLITRYLEIEGFGGSNPIMYNITTSDFVIPQVANDQVQLIVPGASQEHKWVLLDQDTDVKKIEDITKVNFNGVVSEGDYLIISNEQLIHSGAVEEYAKYRRSELGGNHKVDIVSIEELTKQFSYGIKGHPIAIKNYLKFRKDQEALPKFTFIIGKGKEYTEIKKDDINETVIPTFGIPGSDNLLIAFDENKFPEAPIGRLAAQTDQQVRDYLKKVQLHEIRNNEDQSIEDQAWKKSIIHLSGGSAGNQELLFRFLNDMGDVIENNTFGADVFTFRKTSADALQKARTDEIIERINKGASLLTFFGHSAVGTFDFSLENPSKYDNQKRNPVILSLGCHSGNIHSTARGISENFVLEPEKGALAFIASSGTAYPEPQYFTGIDFYNLLGNEMYGQPIGSILQQSLKERNNPDALSVQTLVEQLTLHGDPAISLGAFRGPDYLVDRESVEISPNSINSTTRKITLSFDVKNIGAVQSDVLDIAIIHLLPNNEAMDTIWLSIPAPNNQANVQVDIENPGVRWSGNNKVKIEVDPRRRITEYPESKGEINNKLTTENGEEGISFFVFDDNAKPVQPANYGIVAEAPFLLRAATNNGLLPGGKFQMEIDTLASFNSPFLTTTEFDNTESIIEWQPDIPAIENVVYYWRIAPIDISGDKNKITWNTSSFIYLPDSGPGWNQSHYDQLDDNQFYKSDINDINHQLEFGERQWDIRIKNELRGEGDFWVFVNNTPWASLNPRNRGNLISIFAWDREETIIRNQGTDFGSMPFSTDGFVYQINEQKDIANIIRLLRSFPKGARVFFHTVLEDEDMSLHTEWWDLPLVNEASLISTLENQGASRASEIIDKGTVPYTVIFDKDEGLQVEDIANNIFESIDLSSRTFTLLSEGKVTSIPLQRGKRWLRLEWAEEKEDTDISTLYVLGQLANGNLDTLKVIQSDYDINLTSINPDKYPQLYLVYDISDTKNKTAPQLKFWRVRSSELPDLAFNTNTRALATRDTVNAGEIIKVNYNLENLTGQGMEAPLVRYTLIDEDFRQIVNSKRISSINGMSNLDISYDLSTDQLAGNYQLIIEVNPKLAIPELTECNNFGFASIYVRPDLRNPFLDVTFDGKHIVNGQRIASTPEIEISLRDENEYVLLNDPNDFDITLFYPQVLEWRVDSSSSAVQWIPATKGSENEAKFILRPNLTQKGIYTLVAQAKDIAGNQAGNQAYRISFEVNFDNELPPLTYGPNPATDYVDFNYNLNVDFIPEIFNLYIYSTDGKLIKKVGKAEFGGLKKGLNTYRWHTITNSGNRLPTGIYFFEIVNNLDTKAQKRKGKIFVFQP